MNYKGKRGLSPIQVALLVIAWMVLFVAITIHSGAQYTGKSAGQQLIEVFTEEVT